MVTNLNSSLLHQTSSSQRRERCIDAMAHWLKNGMRQSPEELARWMADCLPNDLRPLLMGGGEGVVDGCVS